MIAKEIQLPFLAKASIFFMGLLAFLKILSIAKGILVPLVFAVIIAMVLHPVVCFFVKKKINRLLAIIITLALTMIVISLFFLLILSQASLFNETWPVLVDKFTGMINQTITEASVNLDINPKSIHDWITKSTDELLHFSNAAIGQTLINVGSMAMILFLVPVYIFMILYYEPLLIDFIHQLFGLKNHSQVSEIVTQTKIVIQRYLIGLLIEAVIIATLYSVTLLTLGIDYAIILGIIGAIINVIPYIGGIVGVSLPMIVALVTKSSGMYAIYILVIFYTIQMIDNHYIIPKVVASKVKINALFSIIVVLAGNTIWGISGMFLSIPLLAIVKLIFDHIEPYKPWGFLLGDTMPAILEIKPILKKILKKAI
ncbi:MAG: AI-2E family transporter [Bacteroidota bacterium]|nr:AI-2E family transporter [Bacteroidota bacterium]